MYKIIDKRGTGKTLRLMLLAKENNGIIVCSGPQTFKIKSEVYGLTGIDFISYNDFLDGKYDRKKKVFIDEIDVLLRKIETNTMGYTISLED